MATGTGCLSIYEDNSKRTTFHYHLAPRFFSSFNFFVYYE